MKVTKKALQEGIDKFNASHEPIPFYDSDDLETREQIGNVVAIEINPNNETQLKYTVEKFNGTCIIGYVSV